MPKILRRTQFGNPILREKSAVLSDDQILSKDIQELIADMKYTLDRREYGVGLAAPQVGESKAISVIGIKKTPTRPEVEPFSMVVINPKIDETYGNRKSMWEGCISCGIGSGTVYAKALRYRKVKLSWQDELAKKHTKIFEGFQAHVIQHEVDHLNGILFVDRVNDSKTYMMASEYRKRVAKKNGV